MGIRKRDNMNYYSTNLKLGLEGSVLWLKKRGGNNKCRAGEMNGKVLIDVPLIDVFRSVAIPVSS